MSSIETNVGSPPIVSLTSPDASAASTRWPTASISRHRLGERLRDTRRLVDSAHVHLVLQHGLALIHAAGNRCRAERLRCGRQWEMPLTGQQPRRWIEADPSRSGQIHLCPGMQVGEIGRCAGRTIEGLHVCDELNQIARYETRPAPGDGGSARAASPVSRHEPLRSVSVSSGACTRARVE